MQDLDPVSDESSFYGDEETKTSFKAQIAAAQSNSYWHKHHAEPSTIAYRAMETVSQKPKLAHQFNYYEGSKSGRQLSETVDEFVARLPPSSTQVQDNGPWIYISNPAFNHRQNPENLKQFREDGHGRLQLFERRKVEIEEANQKLAKSVQTRKLNELRRELQRDILNDARRSHVLPGKWMLFPDPSEVNNVWEKVAHATANSELGQAAKVAADDGSGNAKARLICVYTEDFEDKHDIKRVLQQLKRIGLLDIGRGIYYKADAYTYLEINGGNEWGLKASLYASKDVFKDGWEAQ